LSTTSSLRSDSPEAVPSWKQEVNERLAAHRTRRTYKAEEQASLPLEAEGGASRSAQVAARVAARYAKAPSYSELLAQEAHTAARVAEAAAREARAAAQAVLDGMEKELIPEPPAAVAAKPSAPAATTAAVRETAVRETGVREARARETGVREAGARETGALQSGVSAAAHKNETMDRGIDLFAEATIEPVEPIAGNLIEFPRELVAPRKARPRLAEGPLREETQAEAPQLRIFEVDSEAISTTPEVEHVMPEWSSIRLDAAEDREPDPQLANYRDLPLNAAPLEDRLMAGLVDVSLASLAFLAFVAVFVACTAHPPTGKPALIAAAGALVFFFLLYQFLFFTFSESTPGMRYARIALCTFEDENPGRRQMQHRIAALFLSACTLGMGFAWAMFDEDGLGWHDRLSHTYQRSYR